MTKQTGSTSTDAANSAPPMPSIWRRSVGLALFFTLVGPAIGTAGLIFHDGFNDYYISLTFSVGQILGAPFAATCGIILAVRAAFTGRVNIFETIGAALAATIIVLGSFGLYERITSGTFPVGNLSELLNMFMFFGGPSLFAALVCYWLFYMLFWPRKADETIK